MSNIRTQIGKIVGKSLNDYHSRVKPKIDELRFKEQYQGRIIDCMVGEVDDNYIETPLTDENVVKLEHSKEGVIKIPQIKGKTILIDADGNETDTPGEGCRLVSVGEEEDNKLIILSNNKNLFDGKVEIVEYPNKQRTVNFIKVKPNTNYISSQIFNTSGWTCVEEYDKNFNLIKDSNKGFSNGKFTTLENTHHIKLKWHTDYKLTNAMVVEGNVLPTEFIPHKQHKTEILLDEPLRKLPNGVCDEIVGNKLIRRVGKIVLNEKNNWKYSSTGGGEPYMYGVLTQLPIDCKTTLPADKGFFVTDTLPTKIHNHWSNSEIFGVHINPNGKFIYVNIPNEWLSNIDMNSFKEWIKNNPIEVLYELAEPIIEELPNGITLQGFDDTTMYIENSISPTVSYGYNALIPYKQELLNQKEEVETNTIDIEQNIIPYLMDMEFNLMLMEDN